MPTADGELAKSVLSRATGINDFETACSDWELDDALDEDDAGFEPLCNLCHANVRVAFVIRHAPTGAVLKVGSTCVQRFVRFAGTDNQEDSNVKFRRRANQIGLQKPLRYLANEMLADPIDPRMFNEFRRRSAEFLGVRVDDLNSPEVAKEWERYLAAVNPLKNEALTERIQTVLFNPRDLKSKVRAMRVDKYKHETWRKKARAVRTTLSRSGAYRNPGSQVK